ncbi:hypothetical protein ACIBI9_08355 [Nonomuraea sp. NPDC050451]|uniref:hypothetical protein n=1 Tax=Nonomuraea sp. NPDC050451 TaxID=3364364 RepID=UPI0037A94218
MPVAGGVLAAVLGAALMLAVLRPWDSPGNEAGTPAARGTVQAAGGTLSVQIDSLTRQGGTVRLQWTVKNVGTENAPLAGKLGGGALDTTVSRVNLIPPGVGRPIYPPGTRPARARTCRWRRSPRARSYGCTRSSRACRRTST